MCRTTLLWAAGFLCASSTWAQSASEAQPTPPAQQAPGGAAPAQMPEAAPPASPDAAEPGPAPSPASSSGTPEPEAEAPAATTPRVQAPAPETEQPAAVAESAPAAPQGSAQEIPATKPAPRAAPATGGTAAGADSAAGADTGIEHGVQIGAGLTAGLFNLPSLGIGASLHAQVTPRGFWPIELSATYFFDNERQLTSVDLDLAVHPLFLFPFPAEGSRISFGIAQLSATVCPHDQALSGGRIFVCAGAYGGLIRVEAEGFVLANHSEDRPLFGLEGYVRWRFKISGPLSFTYSAGLFVPLLRERFGYTDRFARFHELFQTTPVNGRVDLALAFRL